MTKYTIPYWGIAFILLTVSVGLNFYWYTSKENSKPHIDEPLEKLSYVPSSCEEKLKGKDFSVADIYTGPIAPIVFDDNSPTEFDQQTQNTAWMFRTKIREGAAQGVNFAGHYAVAEWGLGTGIQQHAIVDVSSGQIISFGLMSQAGFSSQATSSLLVINPKHGAAYPDIEEFRLYLSQFKRDYYTISNNKLVLVCSEPANEGV